jgi:hypothetical protein
MSAHTLVSTTGGGSCTPAGDGLTIASGTFTGSASYDAGGSVLDLSSIFKSKVHYCVASTNDAALSCKWVPGTSNASDDMEVFVDDDAGTEETGNLSGTTFQWFAIGTDA